MTDQSLKSKIEFTLGKSSIAHRFIKLPEQLPSDIRAHVKFHKIQLKDAVPTLIYRTENGLIAVQRRADTKVDIKKLQEVTGIKQLQMASQDDLATLGAEAGYIPLTGLDIPFFIDEKVLELSVVYGGGGDRVYALTIAPKDLVELNKAKVGNFTVIDESSKITKGQRLLSGITPSGDGALHIGNYLGAVKQFIDLAKQVDCFLMVADLHALTTIHDKKTLQHNTETLILNELALLGDLSNITFFRQSDVLMHSELTWILSNVTPLGLLKRAHAYKDKLQKDVMEDDINLGLFNYPILMSADILLYKPDLVPVGKDQKQHVEICRDIAEKFNHIYKKTVFKLPEPYIPEDVASVLGTDGQRKMSKSLGNIISLFADEETIQKQVNATFTDPTRRHATDPGHIEGNMVFAYLDFFGDSERVEEYKQSYQEGKVGDVEVKKYLYESLLTYFAPARERYKELSANPQKVKNILETGAEKARTVAAQTMKEVRDAIGMTNGYSFFEYPKGVPSSGDTDVTIDEFARMDLRVGLVKEASNVEKSDKLIRLIVDFGEEVRNIFTGVRPFGYTSEDFQGKQFIFIYNLAPRKMLNEESQGMIMAVDGPGKPIFLSGEGMPIGSKVR
jgi:tryptophanyl-tRNA synthetase